MDAERLRAFLLTLPHVVETMQWGDNLVFWVGDKAIGGKMFALLNLEDAGTSAADGAPFKRRVTHHALLSYAAGLTRAPGLLERDGITPAPYLARIGWVAIESWDTLTSAEWRSELAAAHALTFAKLPRKVVEALALPAGAQQRLIRDRRAAHGVKTASIAKKIAKKASTPRQ